MKKIFTYIGCVATLMAGVFAAPSCVVEQPHPDPKRMPTAEIPFIARMPAVAAVETRSELGTVPENTIAEIHVLVFETGGGELVYKGKGKNLSVVGGSANNNTVTFRATLPVGTQYDVMVLANAGNDLSDISVGASPVVTKTDILALVRTLAAGTKWAPDTTPIPMWDGQVMILTASSAPVFNLTRMLARVNVEYTPGEGSSVFRLTDVRFYNYNTAGSIVPDAANNMSGEGPQRRATLPTLPPDPGTQTGEYLEYAVSDYRTCKNLIYPFEAANRGTYTDGNSWIDNPCLVVGGKYDSDGDGNFDDEPTTWYRIDFIRKTTAPDGSVADTWLSLLRNFSYNVTIASVGGAGYGDPATALRSAPFNIEAQVLPWNDAEINNVVFDGRYMLGVNRNPFELSYALHGAADTDNILKITADHPDGWTATVWGDEECTLPVPDDAATGNAWLSVDNSGGPGDATPAQVHLLVPVNDTGADRTAWVLIESGRLRFVVRVVQLKRPGTISVTPAEWMVSATIHAGHAYPVAVTSENPDGTEDTVTPWRLDVRNASWCRLAEDPATAFGDAYDHFESTGTKTLYLIMVNNTVIDPRATVLMLGGLPAVNVVQKGRMRDVGMGGDNVPTGSDAKYYTYVGAFWRASQTGERIIRIKVGADPANLGRWAASVEWMDPCWGPNDGVVLAATTLPELQVANPNIYTNNPGDAEDYQLTGITATSITGTVGDGTEEEKYITFRVGLKSQYTPTTDFPARYAVIHLSFGGSKSQRIFLRQGEGADYLMLPQDVVHSGNLGGRARNAAKQFSPYNLTAATLNAKAPSPNPAESAFTDYPTKAGALFQWASYYNSQQRVAWDPYSSFPQSITWFVDGTTTGFWNSTTESLNETCPPGYRRPNDGPTTVNWPNTDISTSEIRQSLWYEPRTGSFGYSRTNSFWGYYADGYFDRRPIEKMQNTDNLETSVSKGTRDVAYVGHLFFNPFFDSNRHNASIFFPASGFRDVYDGRLRYQGREGRYWTSSTQDNSMPFSWSYSFNSDGGASNVNASRSYGYSIRCVKI